MQYLPSHRLRLYRNFKSIETTDYHNLVRFYERYEQGIQHLDFEEYFDCLVAYTVALFEIGEYGKHVVMSDFLLETIILHNVETWGGEDLYTRILFLKSSALCELQEYPKAMHVLRELVKIRPDRDMAAARLLLLRCHLRQKPRWLLRLRALATGLLIFTALFIAVEIFVIAPFFSAWHNTAQLLHNAMLALGIGLIFGGEAAHLFRSQQKVRHLARSARLKRQKTKT